MILTSHHRGKIHSRIEIFAKCLLQLENLSKEGIIKLEEVYELMKYLAAGKTLKSNYNCHDLRPPLEEYSSTRLNPKRKDIIIAYVSRGDTIYFVSCGKHDDVYNDLNIRRKLDRKFNLDTSGLK